MHVMMDAERCIIHYCVRAPAAGAAEDMRAYVQVHKSLSYNKDSDK